MSSPSRTTCVILAVSLAIATALSGGARADDAGARTASSFCLKSGVMGAAGNTSASSGFTAKGTTGQPTPIGIAGASDKVMYAGFWSMPWVAASVLGGHAEGPPVNRVYQNYPNPFTTETTIAYVVATASMVEIAVFNVRGQKVKALVNDSAAPGTYFTTWDGRDDRGAHLAPGVYFYRLSVGDYRAVKKMLLLK